MRQIWIVVALLWVACAVGGCNRPKAAATHHVNRPTEPKQLLISPEDYLVVGTSSFVSGPSITGSIQPERRADLRAEVSAVVLEVLKENGDPVRRGDLLVRLDDTAIRDMLIAATAAARSASQAYTQAERQFQRLTKLKESGLVSAPDVEDAEIRRNTTQSDLEMAKTREVSARQQLQRTQVRAPFNGIVSERQVSTGDTAQIGKELLKVIDPTSMRFEGRVSLDGIKGIRVGGCVAFRIRGLREPDFFGTVARVNPAANATTRQVEVLVNFAKGTEYPTLAGLYAEGYLLSPNARGFTLPESALIQTSTETFAWRLEGLHLKKVRLTLGRRDPRSRDLAVQTGLSEGDRILRYPSSTLQDGQRIKLGQAVPPPKT